MTVIKSARCNDPKTRETVQQLKDVVYYLSKLNSLFNSWLCNNAFNLHIHSLSSHNSAKGNNTSWWERKLHHLPTNASYYRPSASTSRNTFYSYGYKDSIQAINAIPNHLIIFKAPEPPLTLIHSFLYRYFSASCWLQSVLKQQQQQPQRRQPSLPNIH